MDCRMDGRVALITGSSMGTGKAMAIRFAEAGASVAVCARRDDVLEAARKEVEKVGGGKVKVTGHIADVARAEDIQQLFDAVVKAHGQVDILVNNAGASKRGKFEEITDEDWRFDLELKLFGAIRLMRLALPGMKERRWGRIVNILNIGAKAPEGGSTPTSVARAAGMALTKAVSKEAAPFNVLVNAMLVGKIVTDQIARRHKAAKTEQSLQDYVAAAGKSIPIGRMGTAEEFANMACFLCSEQGSYITGCAINVDGGLSPAV
ncbi:MAG: SDR family oxidoreductase [Acetobacterales bacterium]